MAVGYSATASSRSGHRDVRPLEHLQGNFHSCSRLGILLFALANRRVNETVRTAFGASSPERNSGEGDDRLE